MKISVSRLTATPVAERYAPGEGWWRERFAAEKAAPGTDWIAEPVFNVSAAQLGQNIHLSGDFEGSIEPQCGRCLKRYRHALQSTFQLMLEPLGDHAPPDPEGGESLERDGIYLADELELGWYRGDELELDTFLGELIALAWPVQPVCRDDCPGLCPQCGVDRNLERCKCEVPKPESPFAVLEALREGETESS